MTKSLANATLLLALLVSSAAAHETDQFSVPDGEEMADMGPYLNDRVRGWLQDGVDRINKRIRQVVETDVRSLDPGSRPREGQFYDPNGILPYCHSPEGIARAVYDSVGFAVNLIEGLERDLYAKKLRKQYPGQLTAYKAKSSFDSIYNKVYLPIDPRNVAAIFHASTINVYGVYLGTDKIGHFADMGHHYYDSYRDAIRAGKTEDQAMAEAVKLGTDGTFSEKGLLGYLTAGAYSNADLVSNYVGCLFYRNLTESVILEGRLYPPMLERDGQYWKVSQQLDDSEFFARFISDHLNEALNPSLYEPLLRGNVRKLVAKRNDSLLRWYADHCGDNDPATYYERLVHILSTYYGEPYGHSGEFEKLIHLGNTMGE